MRGLNEIITANEATCQMKPQGMTRQEQEELLLDFLVYLSTEIELFVSWHLIKPFLDTYTGE